jgi:hypothetical protein
LGGNKPTQPLRLLPARPKVRRDLDQAGRLGEVDGRVADLGKEDRADMRAALEMLQDPHAFCLASLTVDVWLLQLARVRLERVHVVREDDDLVATVFMILNQELACLELARVHAVEQRAPSVFAL